VLQRNKHPQKISAPEKQALKKDKQYRETSTPERQAIQKDKQSGEQELQKNKKHDIK
jgi:hypothetical protein